MFNSVFDSLTGSPRQQEMLEYRIVHVEVDWVIKPYRI
jgi:hypothetical protein